VCEHAPNNNDDNQSDHASHAESMSESDDDSEYLCDKCGESETCECIYSSHELLAMESEDVDELSEHSSGRHTPEARDKTILRCPLSSNLYLASIVAQ
jgi:hypothetical protein